MGGGGGEKGRRRRRRGILVERGGGNGGENGCESLYSFLSSLLLLCGGRGRGRGERRGERRGRIVGVCWVGKQGVVVPFFLCKKIGVECFNRTTIGH